MFEQITERLSLDLPPLCGEIGSNLGGLLTQGGQDVTLLARGAQFAALNDQGLVIEREGIPAQLSHLDSLI